MRIGCGDIPYFPISNLKESMMLFTARNRHVVSSGNPPSINGNEAGRYHGYFENEHGEQAVFVYDYESKEGTLWMGDVSWEEAIPIENGQAKNIVMIEHERLWLLACWQAATASG